MTQAQVGILVGGLLPALFFGLAGLCQKWSNQHGISTGVYLVSIGVGVVMVGAVMCLFNGEQKYSMAGIFPAIGMGLLWGLGVVLVAVAIQHYKAPLSTLAPLYNMNTLVTVVGALWLFSEWKDANLLRLGLGSILIIAGGIFVSS
ncbi:hypothetical protein [Rubritalea tangerina]|uniref:EamA domain-containing protein n=1 Tax=Rubritalea tangerina TaxID=430798 RepID=A0ABW4Z6R0_9BACT